MNEQRKCTATLEVSRLHECTRPAGHPLSGSVWLKGAETHECCGYQWIDTAEGATPDREDGSRDA